MQTNFSIEQLANAKIAEAEAILRSCVHCGFCTATCPTYVLLGDERDSPRGRIYLIKSMFEEEEAATADVALHIDRCLSCLACMTTCPSGVDYMRLIDQARIHVEKTYRRPLSDAWLRSLLQGVMTRPFLFAALQPLLRLAKPLSPLLERIGSKRLATALNLVPGKPARRQSLGKPGLYPARRESGGRIGLLAGCVQSVIDPAITAAAIRLLTRLGFEVVVPQISCCASLPHHMGFEDRALQLARHAIDIWDKADVECIITTSSGCGTTIKDYGHLLRFDADYADRAATVSTKAADIAEFLASLDLPDGEGGLHIAYQAPCSLQHGQKLPQLGQQLLRRAGFTVSEPQDSHLCCGSAGTYNILQPALAEQLKIRKLTALKELEAQVVATGNIGCATQLGGGLDIPILHTVELLDWAYGGPRPAAMEKR